MCANLAFFAHSTPFFSIAQMMPCAHLVKLIFSQFFQNHWLLKLLHLPLFWNINHVGTFKDLFHLVDYFKDNLFLVNVEFPIPKNYNLLSIQRSLKFFVQPYKQVISIFKCHCFNVVKGTNLPSCFTFWYFHTFSKTSDIFYFFLQLLYQCGSTFKSFH